MSDTESDYSRSPRAFDGESASESSTAGLDSADFKKTKGGELPEAEVDVSVADPRKGVLTVVTGRQRIPMAKPKDLVFGVDHLEPNVLIEAEVAKIRALYNIPELVKMRIPGLLESLSNPKGEMVFFTDVFKHGLRLPLRHSVQKILAAIGYAPGQFNPNFWITLLGTVTAFGIAGEGEPSYEQFAHLYSVTRAKSADQGDGVPISQKTWRQHRVLVSGAWESAPGVIVERHIPTSFQIVSRPMGCLSLKRPIATKREIEVIERVRSRIAEEGRVHKALLDYKNMFKAGLINEPGTSEGRRKKRKRGKVMAGGRAMSEETRRRLESRAPQKKKTGSLKPKTKQPRQAEGASAQEGTPGDRRQERRVAEAELIREAHLQVTEKRVIEGALDVTLLPKRPRGPNEEAAFLVSDEEDAEAEPVNIACPQKVVPFVNCFIDGANMEMSLGVKRAINAAERVQKKYEEGRAKIAEAGKLLQDADRHAEENAAKITELSSRLAEAERAAVDAEEARARAEAAKEAELQSRATELEEAKKQAIVEYRNSPEFVELLDKEVMEQCEDLIYRFKRFNADKKLNLNFVRDPPPLPDRVTEEMVEAYLGEDAEVDSSSGSESDSEEEESTPPAEPLSA
ncbi:unnamed protein product [Prunus armeniaca]